MKLLALEAGGPVLSAALCVDGVERAAAFRVAPRRQTEDLTPLVAELLRGAGLTPAALDAVACGVGPGSFTGLRSSLAFGRGLSLGRPGLRLLGVATLEAWAEAYASTAKEVWVLLDGRRGQVYRGAYRRSPEGFWDAIVEPALLPEQEARAAAGPVIVGDLPDHAPAPGPQLAQAVARLALAALAAGRPAAAWEPRYLRRSEAEILWERLHPKEPA
jgi:tRNA threonylcarbamoyladenosine biosynthesis protein TsaB